MKLVFKFDDSGRYLDRYFVDENYLCNGHETLTGPDEALKQPWIWNGDKWVEGTIKDQSNYQKYFPKNEIRTTPEQLLLMQQAIDINNLKQLSMQMATEMAELKKGSAE